MLTTFKILSRGLRFAFKKRNIRMSFVYTLVIIIIATILLSLNMRGSTYEYNIGDIAREDIRVPRDIEYQVKSETEMEKRRVSEMVPLVFDKDQSVLEDKLKVVRVLFLHVSRTLKENPPSGTDDRAFQLISLKNDLPEYLKYPDRVLFALLRYNDTENLHKIVNRIFIYIYDMGILEEPYKNPLNLNNSNVTIRTVNTSGTSREVSKKLNELKTIEEVKKDLYGTCYSIAPNLPRDVLYGVYVVVKGMLSPNLDFNKEETRRRIDETVNSVQPVVGKLKKGQSIVREGDTITTDILRKIEVLNKHTAYTNINYILGVLLVQLGFLLIFGYFLIAFYNNLIVDNKMPLIIFTLVLFFMAYTFILAQSEGLLFGDLVFALLLPIPFITMILAITYNIHIAMLIGIYIIFFTAMITRGDFTTIVLAFSSALSGVFVVGDVERRNDFLRGGFVIGLINAFIVISTGLIEERTFQDILRNIELAFGNGIINSILVLGVFPVYESIFGITTKFKLLELSDLNAPIFKKMLIKAPGTYNHSLMVATMSESACREIGANSLMARVGSYYHDIGKIDDAAFYIENKVSDPRAKKLSPVEYSKLIISHVEKGVTLAKKYALPEQVIDFIREHHGKTTMTFFYHQALEATDNNGENSIEKSDFEYPGPRPHSRETAVVMLADSVEAASRSLHEPTPAKLESLVRRIVYNKLNESELEHSDLTMSDLNRIQKAFLQVLYGIFHTRIQYPDRQDLEDLEDRVKQKQDNGD